MKSNSCPRGVIWTYVYTVYMWGVFLCVLPAAAMEQNKLLNIARSSTTPNVF